MKTTCLLLSAALGLCAGPLLADDPAPAHVLTLDPDGHPRADLNLSGPHVTGTLDPARLPAGVGGAFLPGVASLTGTDATALDHVDVGGIAPGSVRQVTLTAGGLDLFADPTTAAVPSFVAATFQLVSGDVTTTSGAPSAVASPDAGKFWRLLSGVTSAGFVYGPNGSIFGPTGVLFVAGGSLDMSNGGSIDTSNGGGSIRTSGGGSIDTTSGGSITTGVNGAITTGFAGAITTTTAGSITTGNGGYIRTGGPIDTSNGGSIDTSNSGGNINTSTGGGSIDTSLGGGSITTGSGGYIATGGPIDTTGGGSLTLSGYGPPEGTVSAPVGSLYTDQDGAPGAVLYVKESGPDNTGWVAK